MSWFRLLFSLGALYCVLFVQTQDLWSQDGVAMHEYYDQELGYRFVLPEGLALEGKHHILDWDLDLAVFVDREDCGVFKRCIATGVFSLPKETWHKIQLLDCEEEFDEQLDAIVVPLLFKDPKFKEYRFSKFWMSFVRMLDQKENEKDDHIIGVATYLGVYGDLTFDENWPLEPPLECASFDLDGYAQKVIESLLFDDTI